MSEPYHEETYRGYQLKIYPDDFHDDLDGLMGDGWFGHFVQFTQYEMGSWTDHPFEPLQLRSFTEKDNIMALPVYMYEHGGIRLKIGSFQGLQHRAADMFGELEIARAVVMEALTAIDEDSEIASECGWVAGDVGDLGRAQGDDGFECAGVAALSRGVED